MEPRTPGPPADLDALLAALIAEESANDDGASAASAAGAWRTTWQWVVGAAVVVLAAWLTYTRAGWTPLISNVDFGIHEFGHLIFAWAPPLVVWSAGSVVQVAVPLALAGYFQWRSDGLGVVLTLAWAAESANNVSVYIYDATRLALPLWGDLDGSAANHDWANILTRLGLIPHTDAIAYSVRAFSAFLFAAALAYAARMIARPRLAARRNEQLAARRATLPVREPRNRPGGGRHDP